MPPGIKQHLYNIRMNGKWQVHPYFRCPTCKVKARVRGDALELLIEGCRVTNGVFEYKCLKCKAKLKVTRPSRPIVYDPETGIMMWSFYRGKHPQKSGVSQVIDEKKDGRLLRTWVIDRDVKGNLIDIEIIFPDAPQEVLDLLPTEFTLKVKAKKRKARS